MYKKNICYVITKSEIGGAQKWVKEQTDILTEKEYNCYIATNKEGWLTKNANTVNFLLDDRIEKRISFFFLIRLVKYIKKNKIDILVGNSANGGIYSRIAALITGTKVIYVSHGWSSVYNGKRLKEIYNLIELLLSKISDKVLCVSKNDYEIACQQININPNKLTIIPNQIFKVKIPEKHEIIFNNPLNILFLGRLSYPKDPIPLINAIKNNKKYNLDIVGDGDSYDSIKEKIKSEDIKNVNLLGEIQDFQDFSSYQIFCLISQSEGLPLSAIEAMSCSLPILISNVGGCPELIDNNGYLTDNTPSDILQGLEIITDNIKLYSKNSSLLFNIKFNLRNNYHNYIELYETI